MDKQLNWPIEGSQADYSNGNQWNQAGSNICLDFHGDPLAAKLVVFSDGNHHMALQACCKAFLKSNPTVNDIFYATTPPKVILDSVLRGGVLLGNLHLNVQPHVFISPENILDKLVAQKQITSHQAFARSSGNVLLVKKGNPKGIKGIADLLRDDVRLTISNPITETASYEVYKQTLLDVALEKELDVSAFSHLIDKDSTRAVFGESIHHREVPQTIYEGNADVAIVYYHLALRYSRIFPDDFEIVKIESKTNVYTDYHIGLMNDSGKWGENFLDFMFSDEALELYKEHGLQATVNS
jgi:accessory colonization factor AcfC